MAAAAAAGVDGLVVPDLPVDESEEFVTVCRSHGVDPVLLIAPTTPNERIELIGTRASGFIYCVSVTGVTGARTSLSDTLPDFISRVRRHTQLPLAVGFGVSSPEHAGTVANYADGVIIGSRLIQMVASAPDIDTACSEVEKFLKAVNQVLS